MNEHPNPAVARYLAAGGAHVTVSGVAEQMTLSVSCEGCGAVGDAYFPGETSALRDAQQHAETCRRIPERLWPENAGGAS